MKNRKNKNCIPSYFNIKKYDEMLRLTPLGWSFQFESRYMLYSAITDGCFDCKHILNDREWTNFYNSIIKDYFIDPFKLNRNYEFFSKEHNEKVKIPIYSEYSELPSSIKSGGVVSAMTPYDFYLNHQIYGHFYSDSDNEAFFIQKMFEFHEVLGVYREVPLKIDLTHTDDTLIKEFKRLVLDLRRQFNDNSANKINPKKIVSFDKLETWASYRLLAYMDLKLYSLINKIELKRPEICKALYQFGEYGEDTLRKTIEPIVNRSFYSNGFEGEDFEFPTLLTDELVALHKIQFGDNSDLFYPLDRSK